MDLPPRHSFIVRVTHWLTTICFLGLLVSGIEIVISHPRFYWGEVGNVNIPPLFTLPIPASRATVPTGYGYVLPDQNGWSRYLHFQAAWFVLFGGLIYAVASFWNGHFHKNLLPGSLSWAAIQTAVRQHWRGDKQPPESYNLLQRFAYSAVVFLLFPAMIWTGLAMSPGFTAAFPATVTLLGGQQSARTLHFFVTLLLVLFVIVHVGMVIQSGFRERMRSMLLGRPHSVEEQV